MKKLAILVIVCMVVVMTAGVSFGFMKGERVFETKNGNVTFSIDSHKARGAKCADCHDAVAAKKTGGLEMAAPHTTGCAVCHDGTKAPKNCSNCHVK